MFITKLFKSLFATAEVDGITFYSKAAFNRYVCNKRRNEERKKAGLHKYSVVNIPEPQVGEVVCILEKAGVFDYKIYEDGWYSTVIYYAKNPVVKMTMSE